MSLPSSARLHAVAFFRLTNNIRRFGTRADKKNQIAYRWIIDGKHRPPRRLPQAPPRPGARRAGRLFGLRRAVFLHALRHRRVPAQRRRRGPLRALRRADPQSSGQLFAFPRSGPITSIGTGKTIVDALSPAIDVSV